MHVWQRVADQPARAIRSGPPRGARRRAARRPPAWTMRRPSPRMLDRRTAVRFARHAGGRLESSSGSGLSLDKEPDMSVLDLVQQNLGPAEIQQLSEQIGADPARTQQAVQAAVPMLLGGMASTAQQPDGAQTVAAAAQQHAGLLGGVGG